MHRYLIPNNGQYIPPLFLFKNAYPSLVNLKSPTIIPVPEDPDIDLSVLSDQQIVFSGYLSNLHYNYGNNNGVVDDEGNIYIAFRYEDTTNKYAVYKSSDNGDSFISLSLPQPEIVYGDSSSLIAPALYYKNNKLHIVFQERVTSSYTTRKIYHNCYDTENETWQSATFSYPLTTSFYGFNSIVSHDIVVTDTQVMIVTSASPTGGIYDIYYNISNDNGISWGGFTQLASSYAKHNVISDTDNNIHLLYFKNSSTIAYRKYTTSFSDEEIIDEDVDLTASYRICLNSTTLWVTTGTYQDEQRFYKKILGGSWELITTISHEDIDYNLHLNFTVDLNDMLHVFYSIDWVLYYNRYDTENDEWFDDSILISDEGSNNIRPVLLLTENYFYLWYNHSDGFDYYLAFRKKEL